MDNLDLYNTYKYGCNYVTVLLYTVKMNYELCGLPKEEN